MWEFKVTRKITPKQKLIATIAISLSFFIVELVVGFYTHSLALIADAFHYLSDLVGFVVALVALLITERTQPAPQKYTFGWQRANLLGSFFNAVFLIALAISILVQAIERFVNITRETNGNADIENPKLVLIVGSVGLGLNLVVLSFLHEHDHSHGHGHGHSHEHELEPVDRLSPDAESEPEARPTSSSSSHHEHKHHAVMNKPPGKDLGMLGVFKHVMADAFNNIGVIIAAVIVWKVPGEGRYYADPAAGVFIAFMILLSALPLVKKSGAFLLQIAPGGINLDDIRHDIEMIPGIKSVHELHVWQLDQRKSIASAHVIVDGRTVKSFTDKAKIIMECLHAYGIHSATLQPEESHTTATEAGPSLASRRRGSQEHCQLTCSSVCDKMRCCTNIQMQ
ncbi:cation efflux protein [Thelonectria olida]|uniref:Cation efflux protein n=1 Tax=Thelonectria olida TaxID=1576542 RepID=A0A9P8WD12_9HYPO|nr:cation efflux protein [Thelonectria olida]